MRFTDIPTRKFPLNLNKFTRLQREIQAIADRFDDLGTHDGYAVFHEMVEVRSRLDQTWQLIQLIENREKMGAESTM